VRHALASLPLSLTDSIQFPASHTRRSSIGDFGDSALKLGGLCTVTAITNRAIRRPRNIPDLNQAVLIAHPPVLRSRQRGKRFEVPTGGAGPSLAMHVRSGISITKQSYLFCYFGHPICHLGHAGIDTKLVRPGAAFAPAHDSSENKSAFPIESHYWPTAVTLT
jgi:hypothetical protein